MTEVCEGKKFEALMEVEDLFGSLKNIVAGLKIPLPERWPDDSSLGGDFRSALKDLLENEIFWKTVIAECDEEKRRQIAELKKAMTKALPIAQMLPG
jgi:hypothetical protein